MRLPRGMGSTGAAIRRPTEWSPWETYDWTIISTTTRPCSASSTKTARSRFSRRTVSRWSTGTSSGAPTSTTFPPHSARPFPLASNGASYQEPALPARRDEAAMRTITYALFGVPELRGIIRVRTRGSQRDITLRTVQLRSRNGPNGLGGKTPRGRDPDLRGGRIRRASLHLAWSPQIGACPILSIYNGPNLW